MPPSEQRNNKRKEKKKEKIILFSLQSFFSSFMNENEHVGT
jgi:hypothetical protein